jgi:hypothetical protein
LIDNPAERELDHLIEAWVNWHRHGSWVDGFPAHSPMFEAAVSSADFEQMVDALDARLASAFEAAVSDLPPMLTLVVEHRYLGSMWPLRADLVPNLLKEARTRLLANLTRRGVILSTPDD